jgi:2-polyprenyl-6-methoxyphenol hydroxylase-like FAD-dependent oxidoreductase
MLAGLRVHDIFLETTMARIKTALVIGGGIAGPVTALALRKSGIEATVHEAYPGPAHGIGGVLTVAPNGLDALGIIGVGEALRSVGQPITHMVIRDGRGKQFGEFPGLPGMPPSLVMWRSELCRVLHEHALEQGISIEHGKRLVSVDETAGGVTAQFADGSSASADILIGADGIRSTVRTLIDEHAPGPSHTGLLGFGGRAAGYRITGRPGAMYFVYGKRAFLGHWTAPDGATMWFGGLPHPTAMAMTEAQSVSPSHWLRVLHEVYEDDIPARDLIEHTSADDLIVAGSGEILPSVPHWHRGRMVLVGDAAHAPSSSSGQGASLAIESGVQLARCLRDLPDASTAFAAYEALRRARVEKVAIDAAKTNNRKASGPLGKALMRVLMPIAMKTFLTPKKMFGSLHGYRIAWDDVVLER